ncbi:hypothetical protein M406DRAFT_249857, partial [Cryphonectria parasitica EP155]
FTKKSEKIILAGTRFEKDALIWYKLSLCNHLEHQNNSNVHTQSTKNMFDSFESFEKALKKIFGNSNEECIIA